ncbi:signal-induced proliferation-associated 1-like protein 2 [Limulus polyphemus]|uniref:Signal-induced proliferation-associated 1-like protein 2 n=1 Tax=Limulus polyphemus TaxID=6850 RepID=A0ABM1BS11_LIMPO|nr:signal-induced proliferation-associated 1-like protein 2 [Limulus polyphemus]
MADVPSTIEESSFPTKDELTSDVLRARTAEYYKEIYKSAYVYKSGSMTQISEPSHTTNTVPIKLPTSQLKQSLENCTMHTTSRSLIQCNPHLQNDGPHRTLSERMNRISVTTQRPGCRVALYRSNSNLEIEHRKERFSERTVSVHGNFGSTSSLGIKNGANEGFFSMLKEFKPGHTDQRSAGPARLQEVLIGKVDSPPASQNASNTLVHNSGSLEDCQSPTLKSKLYKLWDMREKVKMLNAETIFFKKVRNKVDTSTNLSTHGSHMSIDSDCRLEEKMRKKTFAHYDCQSISVDLSTTASVVCKLVTRRCNTSTGASAASVISKLQYSHSGDGNALMKYQDPGDGRCNDLVLSCSFFRNELCGEKEKMVSLNRLTRRLSQKNSATTVPGSTTFYRPLSAYGLSVLEKTDNIRWKKHCCPYQRFSFPIEKTDTGALYYRQYFLNQEHQNWFGIDENLGPVAISIRREKVNESTKNGSCSPSQPQFQYRLIVRTSEVRTLRGAVLEEAIPSHFRSSIQRGPLAREVFEYITPEIQLSSLRLGLSGGQTQEQLLKLDEQMVSKTYKVGILYCKSGQSLEEEMYNNEVSGPAFEEFLELIGKRVRLKGFDKYTGGLDNKTDASGLYSVYSSYQNREIMFHVSTMLPYTPNNKQQVLRKRHIGNDVVTIVFQEPGALPFTPKNIRSNFQHVFIVVKAVDPCTVNTTYRVAVSRSKEVPAFGPPIPSGGTFQKCKSFVDFLLAKVINAEEAAHQSEKFVTMIQRTRFEWLKDLATDHVSNTTVETGPKFSIPSFGGKKKERNRPKFIPDNFIQGAISWKVQVEDFEELCKINCLLGISAHTIVLIEESTKEIIFACPSASVLGWSSHTGCLKIFYHQGECIVLITRDPEIDEIQEIVSRLACVTTGCETQELILRRNGQRQIGFHVQYEGVVTEVENHGLAWQAGLRKGSRLLEICKIPVATLLYDQMADLLQTSLMVSVTMVPPLFNGLPRRGCGLKNCHYLSMDIGEENENVGGRSNQTPFYSQTQSSTHQQNPSNQINKCTSQSRGQISQSSQDSGQQLLTEHTEKCDPKVINVEDELVEPPSRINEQLQPTVLHCEERPLLLPSVSLQPSKNSAFTQVLSRQPPPPPPKPARLCALVSFPSERRGTAGLFMSRSELSLSQIGSAQQSYPSSGSTVLHRRGVLSAIGFDVKSSQSHDSIYGSVFGNEAGRESPEQYSSLPSHFQEGCSEDGYILLPSSVGEPPRLRKRVRSGKTRKPLCDGSWTFQKDLLKLIDPDSLDDSGCEVVGSEPSSGQSDCTSTPCSSLERCRNARHTEHLCSNPPDDELITTRACVAHVIPTTLVSSTVNKDLSTVKERYSLDDTSDNLVNTLQSSVPLPSSKELDWSSLVDTASRSTESSILNFKEDVAKKNSESGSQQICQLQKKVRKLQEDLVKEQSQTAVLEKQMKQLQLENQRLHQESQLVVAKLNKISKMVLPPQQCL